VQRIVRAYDEHKTRVAEQMLLLGEAKTAEPNVSERAANPPEQEKGSSSETRQ
jgi:hypothetical protein